MTHREIYNRAKKLARQHKHFCDLLGNIEQEKYGFEFASTNSDSIIDTVNYGINDYPFEAYKKEMEFYAKSAKDNDGKLNARGIYELYGE